jgi:hypothetical protein
MRTVLLGGLASAVLGVVAGMASWSDITSATMGKSPRLEVAGAMQTASVEPTYEPPAVAYAAVDLRPAYTPVIAYEPAVPTLPESDDTLYGESLDDRVEADAEPAAVVDLAVDLAPAEAEPVEAEPVAAESVVAYLP